MFEVGVCILGPSVVYLTIWNTKVGVSPADVLVGSRATDGRLDQFKLLSQVQAFRHILSENRGILIVRFLQESTKGVQDRHLRPVRNADQARTLRLCGYRVSSP